MAYRVGSDIGGTFTDLILASEDGQTFQVGKVLTTPDRPDDAVVAGIEAVLGAARVPAGRVSHVLHGTTLFTNAIIERKGARTALVTTKGFRDAVEIAREHRYDMYDLYMQRPRPIAPRHLRFEIDERVLVDGTVRQPVDPGEVRRLARGGEAGPAAIGRNRGGRRVPAPRVREPRSRASGGDDPAGGAPGGRGHAVERAGPGDPGVRAHVDDARQRVRPASGPALPGAAGGPAARGRRRRGALHHAVQRRALRGRDGRPVPRSPDRVGPRGRRARRRALRRAPRPQGPPVVRHGRHHRQGVRHRRRRAARLPRVRDRPPLSLQEGQRPPDQGPGDRDDRDRHRRGLDRPGRRAPPAPRRAGERGGAPRARWPTASAARSRP